VAKRRAVVIAPGRGTYNKAELGYLRRFHAGRADLVAMADAQRAALGQPAIGALDGADRFDPALHVRGDNAAPLIFLSSYADFLAIDRARFDIVAVTGNSMGWYTALACGGAVSAAHGFAIANDMGTRMHERGTGGQLIDMTLDEDWRPLAGRREAVLALVAAIDGLHISIELGGMIVLAGSEAALGAYTAQASGSPAGFPLRLPGHAAFHSPLMDPISAGAKAAIPADGFGQPAVPMIDGRGAIWRPHMTDATALWDYTLGDQVTRTYDFTRAIAVALREFAPDCLIVLGPGETLGGAVIQSVLAAGWRGWQGKTDFLAAQQAAPFVLALGRADQRGAVVAG
jgi:acyl transferase domain-containing protein